MLNIVSIDQEKPQELQKSLQIAQCVNGPYFFYKEQCNFDVSTFSML